MSRYSIVRSAVAVSVVKVSEDRRSSLEKEVLFGESNNPQVQVEVDGMRRRPVWWRSMTLPRFRLTFVTLARFRKLVISESKRNDIQPH